MTKKLSISNLVENLTREDTKIDPVDPLGLRKTLEAALEAIGSPRENGEYSPQQQAQHQLIGSSIYVGHLTAMGGYNGDSYALGSSKLMDAHARLTRFTSENRPKVAMVGLVAGDVLLPFASQTEQEADNHRQAFQVATGDGTSLLHMVPVELSSTHVDSRVQPVVPGVLAVPEPSSEPVEEDTPNVEAEPTNEVDAIDEETDEVDALTEKIEGVTKALKAPAPPEEQT